MWRGGGEMGTLGTTKYLLYVPFGFRRAAPRPRVCCFRSETNPEGPELLDQAIFRCRRAVVFCTICQVTEIWTGG